MVETSKSLFIVSLTSSKETRPDPWLDARTPEPLADSLNYYISADTS